MPGARSGSLTIRSRQSRQRPSIASCRQSRQLRPSCSCLVRADGQVACGTSGLTPSGRTRIQLFHVFLDGETGSGGVLGTNSFVTALSSFERGVVVGLLVGEGSFGGDGKQPQVTLRMHVRHEAVFRWLVERFPETRLYGPYSHGGRSYYQWMARGRALVRDVLPLLEEDLNDQLDSYASERFQSMCRRYAAYISRERARGGH